jgi:hypothetical protein
VEGEVEMAAVTSKSPQHPLLRVLRLDSDTSGLDLLCLP